MEKNNKDDFIQKFNNKINNINQKEKEKFGTEIKYNGQLSNLLNGNMFFDKNEKFDNDFINKLCETIDNNSLLNEKQKDDLKKYFKFQAYSKAFDYITEKTKNDVEELEDLKSNNIKNKEEIDKQISEKNKKLFNFYNFNEFEKEEDKLFFIMSGARAMTMAKQEYKNNYITLFSEMSKDKNFSKLLLDNLTNIIKFTNRDITNLLGIVSDISKKILNDKENIGGIVFISELNKGLKAKLNSKELYYFCDQFLHDYLKNNENISELQATSILDTFFDNIVKENHISDDKNIYILESENYFNKVKEKTENYINNKYNSNEDKKKIIKSFVNATCKTYINDEKKRNEVLMDFLSKIDKKYQSIIMTTVLKIENIEKNKSKDTVNNIVITNIDELKLKNKAYTLVIKEQSNTEIEMHDYGKHITLDVKFITDENENEKTYSIEIPDMENVTLENIKIYHYSKLEDNKPGIRTEIKFDNPNAENEFKQTIVDTIFKEKGLKLDYINCDEKLNMVIDAISREKSKKQQIDKPNLTLNSERKMLGKWTEKKQKELSNPKLLVIGGK